MSTFFSHTSPLTKIIIIIEFLLVAYLLYSLTKNVYNSYQIDKYIENFELENETIAQENQKKNEDFLYFTSEEYIDKIAKQNLGLINPGEEVIVLSQDVLNVVDEQNLDEDGDVIVRNNEKSNVKNWIEFFFGDGL
ncbi:MAG: septum formation initiator family protein [Candidatus Gracilibacteria bacterium]